ncbi:MAG: ABC transporter permease subunit [Acidimicrobiales bacterium]
MSADAIAHGVILGLVYAMLGVGVVLVYRVSGVVNFAHGEVGALGATVLAKLVLDEHWPFAVTLPIVLTLGGAIGAATEVLIARRLAHRPRLVLLVATIGLTQLVLVVHLLLPGIRVVAPFPTLVHRRLAVGPVVLRGPDFVVLAFVPAVVVALWLWLTRTPSGRALRAVGDNRDAAELAGMRPARVAVAAWATAGALATLAAVLADPLQGVVAGRPSEALGVGLLLRALAAGVVGRLRSLPLALAGGVAVGLIQAAANSGHVDPAVADLCLLLFVLGVVLLRPAETGSRRGDAELARVPPVVRRTFAPIALVASAAAVPLVIGRSSQLFSLSRVALYALVGLSLVVLTGWAGQLSLGQFALVGVGTFSAAILERHGVPFWLTLPLAVFAGGAVSAAIGLPALRLRGMELAVTTLALAVACSGWLFTRSWLLDRAGVATVNRARFVRGPAAYYELCIAALGAAVALVLWIRRSTFGRSLLAVRSDERRAAALGVPPVATKLAAFALAGGLAALAGALLGGLRVHSSPADFGPGESLRIVAITVIGGAGSAAGAVLGAAVVLGVPAIFGSTTIAGLLPSGIGLLALALAFPSGLAGLIPRPRPRSRPRLLPLPLPLPLPRERPRPDTSAPHTPLRAPPDRGGELRVEEVTVRFGGRVALDHVTLHVAAGEVVGLVGANGAGKSTMLDVVSGFVVPAQGTVALDGRSVLHLRPSARAKAGIGRVVQDAHVFQDLTGGEVMQLAGGAPGAGFDVACQDLPTGKRRLLEVAAAAARHPVLLLLDEPTAGLAADELEELVALLMVLRGEAMSILLVEHDLATVARVADRVVHLEVGRLAAVGASPDPLR